MIPAIANSKGVPGTAALVRTREQRLPMILGNYHVLFGKGAGEDEKLWLVGKKDGRLTFSMLGNTQLGRAGNVSFGEKNIYVDSALASCTNTALAALAQGSRTLETAPAKAGMRVMKNGAASGLTTGIITDTAYADLAAVNGKQFPAKHQLLISSENDTPFSVPGDSGAIITGEDGTALGLLWGISSRGESIACPIEPVLYLFQIELLDCGLQPA